MDVHIKPLLSVNQLPFGCPSSMLINQLGQPDEALENYTGELELRYSDSFYRLFDNRLVEATFPAAHQFHIDGVAVVDMFAWLKGQPDSVDMARFRISRTHGLAYDFRFPEHGSITVFEAGRWDAVMQGSPA
ncbi:MAG: hypothetical protein AAF529_09625 [Pseudomonadota bacterium]